MLLSVKTLTFLIDFFLYDNDVTGVPYHFFSHPSTISHTHLPKAVVESITATISAYLPIISLVLVPGSIVPSYQTS